MVLLIGACRYNRGSEALVRGSVKMLKDAVPDSYIVLSSKDDNTGRHLNIEGIDKYVGRFSRFRRIKLLRKAADALKRSFYFENFANWLSHYTMLKECTDADLIIVFGGDNYDSAYGMFADMHSMNKTIKKTTKGKMIFFNCSINPDELNAEIIDDLNMFDIVTARESITYEALKEKLSPMKVKYHPDMAFVMEPEAIPLPQCFDTGKVIGINLSPLILSECYINNKEEILKTYYDIIDYIIFDLDYKVLLIPHVMRNADLSVLNVLYEKYKERQEVSIIADESYNSKQLKYIISNCHMFFGARTHSTIAAYGSRVPTLVLGYSIKSIGIATDLFGKADGYVVPIQSVGNGAELMQSFKIFADGTGKQKELLIRIMPDYLKKAYECQNIFKDLLH